MIRSGQIIPVGSTASFRHNRTVLGFWQRPVAKLTWALIGILTLLKVAGKRRIVYQRAFLTGTRHGEWKALRWVGMDSLPDPLCPAGSKTGEWWALQDSNLCKTPVLLANPAVDAQGDAQSRVRLGRDLSQVVTAWAKLPGPLKAAILAIVNSAKGHA